MLDYATTKGYEYETIPKYDFIVTKTGQKLTTKYDVKATREDTPITPAEQLEIDEKMNKISLSSIIEKMKEKALDEIATMNGFQDSPVALPVGLKPTRTPRGLSTPANTQEEPPEPLLDDDGNVIPF
jgi:hypothetical protein